MSTSTYTSYGKLTKEGNTNSNRGYTNHQDDQSSTGLIYMNARYQDPVAGMFISPDEATRGINSKSSLLANPQSLNSYSYTWNNPINAYDPDGRLTIIVPGTWYGSDWSKTNSLFVNTMNSFSEIPYVMNERDMWTGGNVARDRTTAAEYLANLINNYTFKDGEKLNIVAHSHGGNVSKEAISLLKDGVVVDNFVTLGTPVTDRYMTDLSRVKNMLEVYSDYDWTQANGGDSTKIGGLVGWGILNRARTEYKGTVFGYFETGMAARFESTKNAIDVTSQTTKSYSPLNVGLAHGELYSVMSIWTNSVDDKLIKKK